MRIHCTVIRTFACPIEALFDFTNDAGNLVTFTGFGPIPGIARATYETPGAPGLGARRHVENTNGTEHAEEIVAFERPYRHVSRITGIAPPFAWLVRYALDEWQFARAPEGAVLQRTFTFELTSVVAAIVALPLLRLCMRPAMRRDLENIARRIG